jgi:asparaginyl-tRNA synthetase
MQSPSALSRKVPLIQPGAESPVETVDPQTVHLEAAVLRAAREHLESHGYVEVVVPRIVRATGACENVNTLFEVSSDGDFGWFGRRAYLAQTGQLYLESLIPRLPRVYCVGPSFRAEKKVDHRHLVEFTLVEIEFAGDFEDLLQEINAAVLAMARGAVFAAGKTGLSKKRRDELLDLPEYFPRIRYAEAIEALKGLGFPQVKWGDDIGSEMERALLDDIGDIPLFITHYPAPRPGIEVEKFFNMHLDPEDTDYVLSCDLILPHGGEAVGAAQRHHEYEILRERLLASRMFERLVELGGGEEDFAWYLDHIREFGSVPHAGCGFGMSRILQWIRGSETILEGTAFPSNRAHVR